MLALLLSDDKPGHFRCAEAVVDAIRRTRPVTIRTMKLTRPKLLPGAAQSLLLDHKFSPAFLVKRFYRIDPDDIDRPDIIVSAGGDTIGANIAIARLTGAPNIFFGSLRRFKASDFSLALNSYLTDQPAPNQIRILKPSPADPAKLAMPIFDDRRLPRVAGLLVGGRSGDAQYSEQEWAQIGSFLEEAYRRLGIAWIVSNSRRTPMAVSDRLAALAATSGSPIRRFIDVRTAGPGTLAALFEDSGAIVITADSSAMLSEAIWMRRPAVALRPKSFSLPPKEAQYRRWLEERNLCREVALSDLSPDRFASVLREIVPLTENPQVELAQLLARELPALFAA